MAIPTTNEAIPTYFIYRDIPPGEPFDLTSPLVFFPEKGSDDLFDALRIAFPHVKTHQERMREAMIKHLIEERQNEQVLQDPSPATASLDNMSSWPSMSSESGSLLSSPDMLNLGTPGTSFTNSPQPQAVSLTRQHSVATSAETTPPSLDKMTGVFSVSTSDQPKQRMRRKMTEAEKIEYRKRRIVKACDKCARRKRKCPHNQAEMENVPTSASKFSSRISKSTSPRSGKSATPPSAQETLFDPTAFVLDNNMFADNFDPATFVPVEDFNMFDEPLPELDPNQILFDSFQGANDFFSPNISPPEQDWAYGGTPDYGTQDMLQPLSTEMSSLLPDDQPLPQQVVGYGRCPEDIAIVHNQQPSLQQPVSRVHKNTGLTTDSSASSDAQSSWAAYSQQQTGVSSQDQQQVLGDDRVLRQRVRAGLPEQRVPTPTARFHDAESHSISRLSDGLGDQQLQTPASSSRPSLEQSVLTMTGTVKALRSFSSILNDRSSSTSLRQVSIEKAADAVRNKGTYLHANEHGLGLLHGSQPRSVLGISTISETREPADLTFTSVSDVSRGTTTRTHTTTTTRSAARPQGRPHQSTVLRTVDLQQPLESASPISVLARLPVEEQQRRRPEPSLGEGLLSENADPSYQLYATRKRISGMKNTFTGANMNANLPAGVAKNANLPAGVAKNANLPADVARNANLPAGVARNANLALDTGSSRGSVHATTTIATSTANGGAYPRLVEAPQQQRNVADIAGSSITSVITFAGKPTVTSTSPLDRGVNRSIVLRSALTPSGADDNETPFIIKKRDTNRHKDHHGRPQQASFPSLPLLAILTLLATISSFIMPTASLPLLFFFAIASLQPAQTEEDLVQCTSKNSWWLSTFASRQVGSVRRGGAVWSAGKSQHGRNSAWYKGLMHPHSLSGLRAPCELA